MADPKKPAKAAEPQPADPDAKPETTPDDPGINASITDQGTSTAGREKTGEADPDDPGINANVVF